MEKTATKRHDNEPYVAENNKKNKYDKKPVKQADEILNNDNLRKEKDNI